MLKRLELIGFKSFADKTAFEFASGITAIVGPNGSGKSNVVDAVKWVLGEQSAKSLRGGAMADVIFNGSSTRKGLGLAEVSLIFDNSRKILAAESAEVRITRRVYRDGQGEYLINGQIGRLKDIKELFLGTGAGAHAYSIIEQGRVDALLQSSQDDRRAIFEEAAGISRFKLKKAETLRRLERVGQNLDRLQDILTEVDHQLRSVRQQAAKAKKFQEYASRLKELRLALALHDFHELTVQFSAVEEAIEQIRHRLEEVTALHAEWDRRVTSLEEAIALSESRGRQCEQAIAEASTGIATLLGKLDRERLNGERLQSDAEQKQTAIIAALDRRDQAMLARDRAQMEADQLEANCLRCEETVAHIERQRSTLLNSMAQKRRQIEDGRQQHLEILRTAARWQNDAVSLRTLIAQLTRERERTSGRSLKAASDLASMDQVLGDLNQAEGELEERLRLAKAKWSQQLAQREQARCAADSVRHRLSGLNAEAGALNGRIEVLAGLERSRDGLSAGIRQLFDLLERPENAPDLAATVIAWVADCFTLHRDDAPLIDLALGPLAEAFLIRDAQRLQKALARLATPLAGRVTFLPLDRPAPALPALLGMRDGIIRADALVRCERHDLRQLPARLLGTTYIVPDLATARYLADRTPGCRFATRQGEMLEANGMVVVGMHHAESGLLFRKSELRELRECVSQLGRTILKQQHELNHWLAIDAALESPIALLRQELDVLAEQAADLRSRAEQQRQQRAGLQEEQQLTDTELRALTAEIHRQEQSLEQAAAECRQAEAEAQAVHDQCEVDSQLLRAIEQDQLTLVKTHTEADMARARAREQLNAHLQHRQRVLREVETCAAELQDLQSGESRLRRQYRDCQLAQLGCEAALADTHAYREATERQLAASIVEREQLRQELTKLQANIRQTQSTWEADRQALHAQELAASELRHRRDGLTARMAEDYQIDLPAAHAETQIEQNADFAAAQAEIEDLRKKLQRLGGVNLESLEELAQVELKAAHLQTQFDDLTQARRRLEEIIQKINADSKRLFTDSFATIREHFQDLFRRLFGGGMADIVLANPEDPLETDIDIVARPPGKELRSISLMSGGERTLTAVALLLSIFRSKPSPFCLLDEVDAALDEANTARLTNVLREFASTSQFIVITHAKRTMAAADVLYGVTMQESGISKRIAVRFDDWPSEERRAA